MPPPFTFTLGSTPETLFVAEPSGAEYTINLRTLSCDCNGSYSCLHLTTLEATAKAQRTHCADERRLNLSPEYRFGEKSDEYRTASDAFDAACDVCTRLQEFGMWGDANPFRPMKVQKASPQPALSLSQMAAEW